MKLITTQVCALEGPGGPPWTPGCACYSSLVPQTENLAFASGDRVKVWRRSGRLPFPRYAPETLEKIDGTLDYPPKGSLEAGHEDLEAAAGAERLSAEPLTDEEPLEPADEESDSEKCRPQSQ